MNIAMILAGGKGCRVGLEIPKQFIEVLGKPVLAYTVEAFDRHKDIDAILIVCLGSYIDKAWGMKTQYGLSKIKWITEGGDSFQESVRKGIEFLNDKISRDDTVLIHFGASPFVTEDIISDAIRVCKANGTNAISTTDYYLLAGEKNSTSSVADPSNYSDKYIDRETVAVMNTPHAFNYGFVSDLYKEAGRTGVIDKVEPHTTTLMYAMGKRIFFSKGSQTNLKITTREDLEFFESYVRGRRFLHDI